MKITKNDLKVLDEIRQQANATGMSDIDFVFAIAERYLDDIELDELLEMLKL